MRTQSPPAAAVSPRCAMALWPAATRYTIGRITGAYEHPIALAWALRPSITPAERTAALVAADDARNSALSRPFGERDNIQIDAWTDLIRALRQDHGPGSDDPVELHGRDLALSALWATREVLDRPAGATPMAADHCAAIARAVGEVAHQFSPTDRVLVLRQIADHTRRTRQQLSAEWADTYRHITSMPLDDTAVRHGELPERITANTP